MTETNVKLGRRSEDILFLIIGLSVSAVFFLLAPQFAEWVDDTVTEEKLVQLILEERVREFNKAKKQFYKPLEISGDFSNLDLRGIHLNSTKISGNFINSDLSNSTFVKSEFFGSMIGADLTNTNLWKVEMDGSNLINTTMVGANLDGATFVDSELTNANLHSASLRYVDMTKAILKNTDLSDVNLFEANFRDVRLESANLSGSLIQYTNLQGAFLKDANLSNAMLFAPLTEKIRIYGYDDINTHEIGIVYPGLSSDPFAKIYMKQELESYDANLRNQIIRDNEVYRKILSDECSTMSIDYSYFPKCD